jgi:hypothetical protein
MQEQDAQIVLRLPQEMVGRLKGIAAKLSREFGVPVSLAAAARRFIAAGLEQAGYPEGSAPPADVPVSHPAPRRGAVKARGEAAKAAKAAAKAAKPKAKAKH